MASKDIERALELRAGDIVFYSSSSLSSWFNKLGQRLLHKERVEMTHVAIALSARLILEANPMGSEENQKGLAQETKLSYPRDFEKIRCVFRNPNKTEVSVAAIPRGAMFFRGEEYNHLKIFTSQLLQPLKRTREAEQYGKTFCSALVQGVAEKCNLIPALPTGTLLTPHALMKHLETLGWERIEGSRFIRSATEEAEEKRMQEELWLVGDLIPTY